MCVLYQLRTQIAIAYAALLKPITKHYQAMQFATHGTHFLWDTNHCQPCIQMMLDAAKECHTIADYNRFNKAVQAELLAEDCVPRYHPLHLFGSQQACQLFVMQHQLILWNGS